MKHYLQVPMTGLGLYGGYRGDKWLWSRLRIFHEYVLMSIINRSIDKTLWFCWRPEEKNNPLVIEFQEQLNKIYGFKAIHTFGGILFYDDKYDQHEAEQRLLNGLKVSLPELTVSDDKIFVTIQPSDDMYINLEQIQKYRPQKDFEIIGYTKGYIMNYATKEIADYNPITTPPFYTMIFNKEDFLSPDKHFNLIKNLKSHEDIGLHPNFTQIEGRGFIVGVHGQNISTTFTHRFKGRTLPKEEAEQLMVNVGILYSRALKFPMPWRLKLRKILNKLPFRAVLSNLYHQLPARYKKL